MRISDWSSDVCSSDLFDQERGDRVVIEPMRFAPVDDAETGREGMLFGRDAFGLMTTLGIGVLVLGGLWMLLRAWRRGRDRPLVPAMAEAPFQLDASRIDPIDLTPEMRDLLALAARSEEHTSELQSLMRISYAVFCLQKKK